jgi:hypothetical protein
MAPFNPTPTIESPANFTGASQGIQSTPNTGLGSLFAGLADVLDAGVKEADRQTQVNIREDIFDASDKVLDEFGVNDATNFQSDAEAINPLPSQLAMSGQNLDRLQTAYNRGALKESHYWARMNAMVRQLRSKYPGYRAEIDDMVSGIVGGKPANQLRNALFSEWAAETADAPLPKLEDWAIKNGRLPTDYYERAQSDSPYTVTELASHIATKTRIEAETNAARASIALSVDQGNANTKQIEESYRTEANTFVTTLLSDVSGGVGQQYSVLRDRIADAQTQAFSGEPLDVQQLTAGINQLESDIKLALHQQFTQSWDGNPEHSYTAQLSVEQRNEAITVAMTPITILRDALSSENPFGLMNAVAANTTAKQNQQDADLLAKVPVLETLASISRTSGPEALSIYLSVSPQIQSAVEASLLDYAAGQALTGGNVTDSFSLGESSGAGSEYFNAITTRWTKIADQVAKGEVPLDMVQANVDYMFGPSAMGVLAQLDDDSRFAYFQKVSSPTVTKQMLALRDMGDVDSWNKYQQWTTNAFMALYQQSVQDLQALNTSANYSGMSVRWDPQSKGFVLRSDGMFGVGAYEAPVQKFNSVIRTITPIIEANGGDVEQELYGMMTQMGFDASEAREDSLWTSIVNSLIKGLNGGVQQGDGGIVGRNQPKLNPGEL